IGTSAWIHRSTAHGLSNRCHTRDLPISNGRAAEPARAAGPPAARSRALQPRDRPGADRLGQHGQNPPAADLPETQRDQPPGGPRRGTTPEPPLIRRPNVKAAYDGETEHQASWAVAVSVLQAAARLPTISDSPQSPTQSPTADDIDSPNGAVHS